MDKHTFRLSAFAVKIKKSSGCDELDAFVYEIKESVEFLGIFQNESLSQTEKQLREQQERELREEKRSLLKRRLKV